jgi:hypothetical protein
LELKYYVANLSLNEANVWISIELCFLLFQSKKDESFIKIKKWFFSLILVIEHLYIITIYE